MSTEKLSPEEAADRFLDDPSSILISFQEVLRVFNITWPEMLKELQSGRLKACQYEGNFFIDGAALAVWIDITGNTFSNPQRH